MTVCAIAMSEVKEDSILCTADACLDWDDAVDIADDFMLKCVGDYYDIDPAFTEKRRAKVDERVSIETNVVRGMRRLECHFEDPSGGLVVATSVQETEIR